MTKILFVYVTLSGNSVHFAKNKILRKPRKCKFGPEILILSFRWILEEKPLKFRVPCMKSLDSAEIHLWDE